MTRKVVVIGLDSADADLVDRWCREGHLPVLASLRARGAWGRLGTTADVLHVSGWPSFYTGTTPDRHGLYHAYVMRPGCQVPVRPRPHESPEPFFWKLLSDAGTRSLVVDAFMNCPLEGFAGTQVVEYGTWTWFAEPTTRPRELQDEILAKFGPYPAEDHSKVLTPPDCAGFRDRLLRGAARKADLVTWLMRRESWDFAFTVFGEPHPAGHYLWHLHDASHPAHPGDGAGPLGTALRDVYAAIDAAIGDIVRDLPSDTLLLVVSVDGMGPNWSGSHLLEEALRQLGLYVTADAPRRSDGDEAGPRPARGRKDLVKRLRGLVPAPLRVAVSRHLLPHHVKERLNLRWMTTDIVWSATRAFLIANANEGYIRVNLAGREPEGIVAPGAEYEQLCESLLDTMRELVNPRTGRPAARSVRRADDLYRGPCRDRLPDVIVGWDPAAGLTTELFAGACGLVKTARPAWETAPFYTGNHEPRAFVIAHGPGIPAGMALDGAHVLDLAPTLLAAFGVPRGPSMDGRVIPELVAGSRS
jgi:predicted AlkP superfamily phosphohydrolase/phosphomutase